MIHQDMTRLLTTIRLQPMKQQRPLRNKTQFGKGGHAAADNHAGKPDIKKGDARHVADGQRRPEGTAEHIAGRQQQLQAARRVNLRREQGLTASQRRRQNGPGKDVEAADATQERPPKKNIDRHNFVILPCHRPNSSKKSA